jgi:hypothetical protein
MRELLPAATMMAEVTPHEYHTAPQMPIPNHENQVDVKAGEGLWHGLNRPFRAG